ncbi:13012_t:CDS:2, partial [Cetraspora pellucida]
LSHSEDFISDKRNNMVDDISVECNNLINDNDVSDEHNNLINNKDYLVNEYEDGWVNDDDNLVNEYEDGWVNDDNNLVNEYEDSWVNDDYNNMINDNNDNLVNDDNDNLVNENNQDNSLHSILRNQSKNMSKTPNFKEINCLVEVYKNKKSELCGHLMGSVDKSSHHKKIKQPLSSQLQIDKIIYNHPEHKCRLDQRFVELLIKDQQPINIRNDEGLKDFIAEFDPSYQFSSERYCRQLLSEAYENTKQSLLDIFEKNLVIGKGLLEIEDLVKRAKKLMLYFTTPKQTQ